MGPLISDYYKWLITLTVMTLIDFYCSRNSFGLIPAKNLTSTVNHQALPQGRLALVFRVEPTTRTITATGSGSRTQEHSSPSGRNRFVKNLIS